MDTAPTLIPVGTRFRSEDITHWQGKNPHGTDTTGQPTDSRTLEQALAEADLLVSTPHSGAAIPEELAGYLAPELTQRLQYDFSDVATASVVRRWADIDPRIVAVINPHPRMVRDPNRAKPEDVVQTLSQAIERVAQAGKWNPVDLSGVDAIRPVTFSFFPILQIPEDHEALQKLCQDFADTAEQGLGVYERTRDELLERLLQIRHATASPGAETSLSFLSFHDTMNTTTTAQGAVNVPRKPEDRLPNVVALSNRGDQRGEARTEEDPPSMNPQRLRRLAEAHRAAFEVASADEVQLNTPYLGSQEIIAARERFSDFHHRHPDSALLTDAVQAEFRREYLLGQAFTAQLHEPGTSWPQEDPQRVEFLARACKAAWDRYRG